MDVLGTPKSLQMLIEHTKILYWPSVYFEDKICKSVSIQNIAPFLFWWNNTMYGHATLMHTSSFVTKTMITGNRFYLKFKHHVWSYITSCTDIHCISQTCWCASLTCTVIPFLTLSQFRTSCTKWWFYPSPLLYGHTP